MRRTIAFVALAALLAALVPVVGTRLGWGAAAPRDDRRARDASDDGRGARRSSGERRDGKQGERPGRDAAVVGRVHERFQPLDGKIFVLVIGNDARTGNPDRSRADALHLVGLNAKTMKGGILNFPRDSWVPIPGSGSGKINEALYRGGPKLQARTVEQLTGIRIDYYVMTGFEGFMALVRKIGDIPYRVDKGMFDPGGSGAHIPAGTRKLDPGDALAFARTRKSLPNGDIGRTTNQGRLLLAMLRQLRDEIARNPGALLKWIEAGRRYTRLDISPAETFRLAVLATQVKPADVGMVTVPATIGSVGAASVVFIQPSARAVYARFKRTASL
ncbi:MAG TPA: LCP family protein [Actinomycetota bacterium]|nr:LCP family protein [Actinomycetota bacterium]